MRALLLPTQDLRGVMMQVEAKQRVEFNTTRFGVVEIDQENIVRFNEGIPGFPEARNFVLIPHKEDSPFAWLQSVDMADLAFVVTDPWLFFEDYQPVIDESVIEELGAHEEAEGDSESSIVVMAILTIPKETHKMTANLQAPVIINTRNNRAKQVILSSEEYTTKHRLLPDS